MSATDRILAVASLAPATVAAVIGGWRAVHAGEGPDATRAYVMSLLLLAGVVAGVVWHVRQRRITTASDSRLEEAIIELRREARVREHEMAALRADVDEEIRAEAVQRAAGRLGFRRNGNRLQAVEE